MKFFDEENLRLCQEEQELHIKKETETIMDGAASTNVIHNASALCHDETHPKLIKPIRFEKVTENFQKSPDGSVTVEKIKPITFSDKSTDNQTSGLISPITFYAPVNEDKIKNIEIDGKTPDIKAREGMEAHNLPIPNLIKAEKEDEKEKNIVIEKAKINTAYSVFELLAKKLIFIIYMEGLYYFNGIIYEFLTLQTASRLIMQYCRKEIEEAGIPQFVKNIYNFITIEPKIVIQKPNETRYFVAFKNGVLNIMTNAFQPPNPKFFLTSYINCDYVPGINSECPNFNKFLHTVTGNDYKLITRIWETIGYLLSNDNKGKKLFIFQGVKDSGKSTLGNFLASLLNEEARTNITINDLNERFGLVELIGKKINTSLDLPDESFKSIAVSKLKQLTGGDILTAEPKYLPRIKFENTCKLLYATNFPITLTSNDEAFMSRIVAIPFYFSIPQSEWNTELISLFEQEKLAIIKNAFNYYRELVNNKYVFTGDYKCNEMFNFQQVDLNNTLSASEMVSKFVDNCCEFCSQDEGTFTRILYDAFRNFYEEYESYDLITISQFSIKLQEIYGEFISKNKWRNKLLSDKSENGYKGIVLKQ